MLTPAQHRSVIESGIDLRRKQTLVPSICVHRACINILWAEHSNQVAEFGVRRVAGIWKCDNARKTLLLLLVLGDLGISLVG
jgi:hypothetical protein